MTRPNDEITEFEKRLCDWTPAESGRSVDALVYEAGRRSRRPLVWPVVALLFGGLALCLSDQLRRERVKSPTGTPMIAPSAPAEPLSASAMLALSRRYQVEGDVPPIVVTDDGGVVSEPRPVLRPLWRDFDIP